MITSTRIYVLSLLHTCDPPLGALVEEWHMAVLSSFLTIFLLLSHPISSAMSTTTVLERSWD